MLHARLGLLRLKLNGPQLIRCQLYSFQPMKQCQNLLEECLANQLSEMQSEGTYKQERIILSPQGSQINTDTMENPGKSVLNMCSNNYLGWCNLPGNF